MYKARKRLIAHPGKVVQMLLLENGITQTKLAEYLHIPQTKVSEICRCKRGISAEMALKLERVLGISANIWMEIQTNWELSNIDLSRLKKYRLLVKLNEKEISKKAA